MRRDRLRLHDVETYHWREGLKDSRRLALKCGAAVTSAVCAFLAIDAGVTEATIPDELARAEFAGNVDCKSADFVVVYVNPTGKPVVQWLEKNNRKIVESHNGASLVTWYGTKEDINGFRDVIDDKLKECVSDDGHKIPVAFNGLSLGGKVNQWVIDAGLKYGEPIANIMEATPPSTDTIKDLAGRALVTAASNGQPMVLGRGSVFVSSTVGEQQRNGLLSPLENSLARKFIIDSTLETNPKVVAWQTVANSRPYSLPLSSTANTTPVSYIYSPEDRVTDTVLALAQLRLLTKAEVTEYKVAAEQNVMLALNHADGWRKERRDAYDGPYEIIYQKIADKLAARRAAYVLAHGSGNRPV